MFRKPSDREPEATFARSFEALQLQTARQMADWGLGKTDRWDADLETGIIKFSNADGFTVIAPLQVVGSYNSEDGTWLWGWDHPSVPGPLSRAAKLTLAFGLRYDLPQLIERKIECSEDDAWRFTALAFHLSGAAGAYRGQFDQTGVFMTFGEVTVFQAN
jgi:hypothetical protein